MKIEDFFEVAHQIKENWIGKGQLSSDKLHAWMRDHMGMTQASGAFDPRDLYSALQVGQSLSLLEAGRLYNVFHPTLDLQQAGMNINIIKQHLDWLPTHTNRDDTQLEFQQFSTTPHLSYVASWLAQIKKRETVLEPSAGLGSLAVFPMIAGANLLLNELEPSRFDILSKAFELGHYPKEQLLRTVHMADAGHLYALQPTWKADVIVMNPPFASNGATGAKDSKIGSQHIEAAMHMLKPGGRLVAIAFGGLPRYGEVGGLHPDNHAYAEFWRRINNQYSLRLNLGLKGEEFKKYGTEIQTRLIVIDKIEPGGHVPVVNGLCENIYDVLRLGMEVAADRPQVTEELPKSIIGFVPGESKPIIRTSGELKIVNCRKYNDSTMAERFNKQAGRMEFPYIVEYSDGTTDFQYASDRNEAKDLSWKATQEKQIEKSQEDILSQFNEILNGRKEETGSDDGNTERDEPEQNDVSVGEGVRETVDEDGSPDGSLLEGEASNAVFQGYRPYVRVSGSKPHAAPLVESDAMRLVKPPRPSAPINIPKHAITGGRLSAAQLETIAYAINANSQILSDGITRKAYLVGHGTGFGKGATLAGCAMHYKLEGHERVLWLSKSSDLVVDAKRDWVWVGGEEHEVFAQKNEKHQEITRNGIMFSTYSLMSTRQTNSEAKQTIDSEGELKLISKKKGLDRFDQVVNWTPTVIIMDESHEMGNAIAVKGSRGNKAPSQKALSGIEMLEKFPDARVIFASATAATEVRNLAYAAKRLGLYGENIPAFPSLGSFVNKIEGGGMLAMELVAKDMKAMGLYMATNLSYEGTEFEVLTHNLTDNQIEMYNHACEAWRIVLESMEKAMEVNNSTEAPRLRGTIRGQFYGAMQRFFNQLLTSIQTPTAIKDMERELAEGNSIVIQLVNTNEAATDRAVAAAVADGISLDDLDITPRDTLKQLVESTYPITLYQAVPNGDDVIYQPVIDDDGNQVANPIAVAMKEELLMKIDYIKVPEGALDMIINHFGPDQVAEITGRSQRYVMKTDQGETHREREARSKTKCNQEAKEFMGPKLDGSDTTKFTRRILIFSGAGNTGRSFQSDLRYENQQRRIHYVLQPGWRADEALQGLGRTHRTNQANSPLYKLITTELKGQKRFITSIARRIEQLGSLTKGNRKAASGGLFSSDDNLENPYSAGAITEFFLLMHKKVLDGLSFEEVTRQMGLDLMDKETGGFSTEKAPSITTFLNRLLCLDCDMQDKVFDTWYEIMQGMIDAAKEKGTYDRGVEKLFADSIVKIDEMQVYKDKESGAVTRVVELALRTKNKFVDFEMVLKGIYPTFSMYGFDTVADPEKDFFTFRKNKHSGKIYAYFHSIPMHDSKTGDIENGYRKVSPTNNTKIRESEMNSGGDERVTVDEARVLWDEEVAAIAEYRNQTVYLLTGAILPIWDKIEGRETRIVVAETDEGERMIGRMVENQYFNATMKNLGAAKNGTFMTQEEWVDAIKNQKATVWLSNKYGLTRRRIRGELCIQVLGVGGYGEQMILTKQGFKAIYEQNKLVVYIPADENETTRLDWLLETRFPTEIELGGINKVLLREKPDAIETVEVTPEMVVQFIDIDHLICRHDFGVVEEEVEALIEVLQEEVEVVHEAMEAKAEAPPLSTKQIEVLEAVFAANIQAQEVKKAKSKASALRSKMENLGQTSLF